MTDDIPIPASENLPNERPLWTSPMLEEIGSIHDVEGGQNAGNDTNGVPSRIS